MSKKLKLDIDTEEIDMFASTSPIETKAVSAATNKNLLPHDCDDDEGYYSSIIGELILDRFKVVSVLGRGVFSEVLKCIDSTDESLVAIKIIRNNSVMFTAGQKEIKFLQQIKENDPKDKMHLIRYIDNFMYKNHLCIVFENLCTNLRQVLKKFGKNTGLNIQAIKLYAQQLFKSLMLLEKLKIIHADIKPDNILVNDTHTILKLCDLGSATTDFEITPYLCSRFYRAPEIILGLQFDCSIDVWSVGCTLYELFTGKILFAGKSNNSMLKQIQNILGKIPTKFIKKGKFSSQHYNMATYTFRSQEIDKISQKEIVKDIVFGKPTFRGLFGKDEETNLLCDFLERCLCLSPDKRITPREALIHPFVKGDW